MTEKEVISYLITFLEGQTELTAKIGTFTINGNTYYRIANRMTLPKEWSTLDASILLYMVGSTNNAINYGFYLLNAMCRAKTMRESRDIAFILVDKINRLCNDLNITTAILRTIPPKDEELDSYKTPIQIKVKTKL